MNLTIDFWIQGRILQRTEEEQDLVDALLLIIEDIMGFESVK